MMLGTSPFSTVCASTAFHACPLPHSIRNHIPAGLPVYACWVYLNSKQLTSDFKQLTAQACTWAHSVRKRESAGELNIFIIIMYASRQVLAAPCAQLQSTMLSLDYDSKSQSLVGSMTQELRITKAREILVPCMHLIRMVGSMQSGSGSAWHLPPHGLPCQGVLVCSTCRSYLTHRGRWDTPFLAAEHDIKEVV